MLAIGIDFGTTNSSIWFNKNNHGPVVCPLKQMPEGYRLNYLPGFIYFAGGRRVYIGDSAREFYHLKPHRVAKSIKRNLNKIYKIGKNSYSATELAKMIFRYLLRQCREVSGEIIKECVLCIPASFNHQERKDLKTALEQSSRSLKAIHFLDEPIAVLISHLNQKELKANSLPSRANLCIIDMGGGTTDVAIVRIEANRKKITGVEVYSLWTRPNLGGDDFDSAIAGDIISRRAMNNITPVEKLTESERKFLYGKYIIEAENIKKRIKQDEEIKVEIKGLPGENPLIYSINDKKYSKIVKPLILKFEQTIAYALSRGGIGKEEIDDVVITGGMSKSYLISQSIIKLFNKNPQTHPNPELIVGKGGCIYHSYLLKGKEIFPVPVKPVLSKALFVRVRNSRVHKIFSAGTPLPAKTRIENAFITPPFPTSILRIPFYQGENSGKGCELLTMLTLKSPAPIKPGSKITLKVKVDEDKKIFISANLKKNHDSPNGDMIQKEITIAGI